MTGEPKRFFKTSESRVSFLGGHIGKDLRMYGILAACIATMAMFLGLFALSVESEPRNQTVEIVAETETVLAKSVKAE